MSKKGGVENNITTPENEYSVKTDLLKGYSWKDGEEIHLKDGAKLVLVKNGKKEFGFTYIDAEGKYFPDISQIGGISGPEDKNSPFVLFGNTIMEAGTDIPEKDEENKKEEKEEPTKNQTSSESKIKISPSVKKIADEKGLTEEDLRKITGTGKNENLTKKDIENYLEKNSTPNEEKMGEWKELPAEQKLMVLEEGNISIKKGSEFYLGEFKYVVTSIKEREVGNDEIECDIECNVSGESVNESVDFDLGELEEYIKEIFDSVNGDKAELRKVLFTPPKSTTKKTLVKKNENKKTNDAEENGGEKFEKEIKINGFVFVAGKTTFQSDGQLFRVDKIKEVGNTRMDWELTVSKIDPITKEVIEQKQKTGNWLNEIIKDFASKSEIDLRERDGKKGAVNLATKEKRELAEKLEELKNRKTKSPTSTKKAVDSVKKEDEGQLPPPTVTEEEEDETQQDKIQEANELADFFSNNLSSSFLKPKAVTKKEVVVTKVEQKKNDNNVVDKNRQWAPDRATRGNEFISEKKNEPIIEKALEKKTVVEKENFIQTNENAESGLSLKEIIERERPRVDQVHSENLQKDKKEKRGNKWRNAWGWALGLLGLGATAYGVKEYSEKDPNDKGLENESKYQYNIEKEPEGFYYKDKKDSSKQKIEEKETKTIFDETKKDQEKKDQKTKIKSPTPTDSTKKIDEIKPIEKIQPKVDSSKVEIKDIQTPEAPKFLVEAVSIYHPELTNEEKSIIGNSYSKVLEYISGEEDVESFYKNISWLNTMSWSIDSTLDVSKKVLAGEYGEVGETEKRMAEYFINFAKRQEEKGLPANGMNTEAYIISGLIKDAGIKKE